MQSNAASATEYRTQFVRAMSDVRPHRSNTSPEIKSKIRPEKETASSVERGGSHRERMQLRYVTLRYAMRRNSGVEDSSLYV